MAWVAPALSALGARASAGASGSGAYQTGQDKLRTQGVQAPGWARGLQNMFSRAIAQNAFNTAPSFGDFISSVGTARFPINFTGLSPQEMRLLGFVVNAGEPLPFTETNRIGERQPPSELTDAQRLFLGAQDLKYGRKGPLRTLASKYRRGQELEAKLADPYISERRKARLEGRLMRTRSKTEDLYDAIMRRGHGTGSKYSGSPEYDVPPRAPAQGVRRYYPHKPGGKYEGKRQD